MNDDRKWEAWGTTPFRYVWLSKSVLDEQLKEMLAEYSLKQETCKPLDFLTGYATEMYYLHDGEGNLVGVARLTKTLLNPCHGNIGISIRPSMRGRGYGKSSLAHLMSEWERINEGARMLACVEMHNKRSMNMFMAMGFTWTKISYEWFKEGAKRIALELAAPF